MGTTLKKAKGDNLLLEFFARDGGLKCIAVDTDLGAPSDWMALENRGLVEERKPLFHRYSYAITPEGKARLKELLDASK